LVAREKEIGNEFISDIGDAITCSAVTPSSSMNACLGANIINAYIRFDECRDSADTPEYNY